MPALTIPDTNDPGDSAARVSLHFSGLEERLRADAADARKEADELDAKADDAARSAATWARAAKTIRDNQS